MEITYTLQDVDKVADQLINNVKTKILLFYGNMGVGKTTLIKEIVKALGSDDETTSPTFSLVNEYSIKDDLIYHFDCYRIKDVEEAYDFGIEEYLSSNNWCIIEWPERIESIIETQIDRIYLELNPDNSRTLKLNNKTNV